MLITSESLKQYAGENVSQRKTGEGDRLERSKFIISCLNNEEKSKPGFVSFTAYCLSASNLKEQPCEVTGEFTESGEILPCVCSCAAGPGEMCEHIMTVLKYLEKREQPLPVRTRSDKKNLKRSSQTVMENFEPVPLLLHPCYAKQKKDIVEKYKKQCLVNVSDAQSEQLLSMIYQKLPNSALAMDKSRRHAINTT